MSPAHGCPRSVGSTPASRTSESSVPIPTTTIDRRTSSPGRVLLALTVGKTSEANLIVELNDGRITENEQLIELDGIYAALYGLQARAYA
jgi:hypothetical protein